MRHIHHEQSQRDEIFFIEPGTPMIDAFNKLHGAINKLITRVLLLEENCKQGLHEKMPEQKKDY